MAAHSRERAEPGEHATNAGAALVSTDRDQGIHSVPLYCATPSVPATATQNAAGVQLTLLSGVSPRPDFTGPVQDDPLNLYTLPYASVAMQNLAEAQLMPEPASLGMRAAAVDQPVPFHMTTEPREPSATQYTADTHETYPSMFPLPTIPGALHECPVNMLTSPSSPRATQKADDAHDTAANGYSGSCWDAVTVPPDSTQIPVPTATQKTGVAQVAADTAVLSNDETFTILTGAVHLLPCQVAWYPCASNAEQNDGAGHESDTTLPSPGAVGPDRGVPGQRRRRRLRPRGARHTSRHAPRRGAPGEDARQPGCDRDRGTHRDNSPCCACPHRGTSALRWNGIYSPLPESASTFRSSTTLTGPPTLGRFWVP